MLDDRRLAVHELARALDLAAVDLDERLVAEADPERRHALAEPPQDLGRRARVLGPARPRAR